MILLTDNDILVKLSQCDLVSEALEVFHCLHRELFILDTAKYSLFLGNPDKCISKRVGNSAAYDRLCEFVGGCSELGAAIEDLDFLDEIALMENIDPGEQQLLLHAHSYYSSGHDFYLATGDRKALEGIKNSGSQRAHDILRQRVECLESLFIRMLHCHGFDCINSKVSSWSTVTGRFDKVLNMAFGPTRDYQHATDCLSSYIASVAEFIRR